MTILTAVLIATLFLPTPRADAQSGDTEWAAFTSMRQINDLLVVGDRVWVATQGGVLRFDRTTREYTRFTRLDGLAGNTILSITRDSSGDLWFGSDGKGLSRMRVRTDNFDPPFLEFEGLSINVLLAYRDRIFVGTDRGVSVFLIEKEEVKETYRKLGNILSDTAVTSLAVFRQELWVGTAEGLAWADLGQPNLQDPDSWHSKGTISVRDLLLTRRGDPIIATKDGSISYNRLTNRLFDDFTQEPVTAVGVLLDGRPIVAGESGNFFRRNLPRNWTRVPGPIITDVRTLSRRDGGLWMGTGIGLRLIGLPTKERPPLPREPAANRFFEMKLLDDELWVASVPNDQQESFGLYQKAADDSWTVHDRRSGMPVDDLVSLETDAAGRLWVGTWGSGVSIRQPGNDWLRMDQSNSILAGLGVGGAFVPVSDIARDLAGNMWLVNVTFGLVVVDGFPVERSFLFDNASLGLGPGRDLSKVILAADGLKWLASPIDGFLLLDDGGTPFDGDDDVAILMDGSFDPRLTSTRVFALVVGDDGTVWVGTDNGLNAVRGTYSRQTRSFEVDQWLVFTEEDGLGSSEINALAVDDGGNVWVGTEGGLSQIAGDEVVFTLTKTNSGLIDNRVKSLLFDGDKGEMWIGTFDGLSRLRISSGGGGGKPLSGLVVYPNPFVTGEADELTFSGLPLGASLKIYGLDGQLVARVPGVPGRATLSWRGQNEAGFVVGSGIYYFVAADSGGKRITGKVAVVNGSR